MVAVLAPRLREAPGRVAWAELGREEWHTPEPERLPAGQAIRAWAAVQECPVIPEWGEAQE